MTHEQAAKDRSDLAAALGEDWTVELELAHLWGVTIAGLVATSLGRVVLVECHTGWWLLHDRPIELHLFHGCVYRAQGIATLAARVRAIAAEQ